MTYRLDRKSTRLNSSHVATSYAVSWLIEEGRPGSRGFVSRVLGVSVCLRCCIPPAPRATHVPYSTLFRSQVVDRRIIKSSSGNRESRYVIRTPLKIGEEVWDIEITHQFSMEF